MKFGFAPASALGGLVWHGMTWYVTCNKVLTVRLTVLTVFYYGWSEASPPPRLGGGFTVGFQTIHELFKISKDNIKWCLACAPYVVKTARKNKRTTMENKKQETSNATKQSNSREERRTEKQQRNNEETTPQPRFSSTHRLINICVFGLTCGAAARYKDPNWRPTSLSVFRILG